MKRAIPLLLLTLAGCGLSPEYNAWAQKRMAEVQARQEAEQRQRAAYLSSPAGQAESICQYKASAAMASRSVRSLVDLEGAVMEVELKERCLNLYRQTGVMPTY